MTPSLSELASLQEQINNLNVLYYDTLTIQLLRDTHLFRALAWVYRSNWRILHIDGFEGGRKLPIATGGFPKFFTYEEDL